MTKSIYGAHERTPLTPADFAKAEFARHPDGSIAARLYGDDELPWLDGETPCSDAEMAQWGWSPVWECQDRDVHWRYIDLLDELNEMRHQRNEARARADHAEQSRGFTAEDVTPELARRVAQKYTDLTSVQMKFSAMQQALEFGFTPTRPEGAEDLQALIDEWADGWGCASDPSEDGNHGPLADFLASRGVRVVGEEQP